MAVQSASLSDQGRRKNNEDFVTFFEPTDPVELKQNGCLYIVADGVGGAARGERASQFAAQKILYEYYQSTIPDPLERLREIITRVNDQIYSYASQNQTRMATTLVAVVIRGGFLYAANVGDSRAYLIRDRNVIQVTRDHSIVGEMVGMGEMTEEEAMASKIKNRLTRSLGGDEEVSVEVYPPLALKTGDKVLLCSDGLTRYALREDLARMSSEGDPAEIARKMIHFAKNKGGADNISVVTVSYVGESVQEPTVHIERPKQVELDTLITQPGGNIGTDRKRKSAMTVSWLVFLVGAIVGVALLGWMLGDAAMGLLNRATPTTGSVPIVTESITPLPLPSINTATPIIPAGVTPIVLPTINTVSPVPTFTPPSPAITPIISTSVTGEVSVISEEVKAIVTCEGENGKQGFASIYETASAQINLGVIYSDSKMAYNLESVLKDPNNYVWLKITYQFTYSEKAYGSVWLFYQDCITLWKGSDRVKLNLTTLSFEEYE